MKTLLPLLAAVAAVPGLVSCANPSHLIVYQHSNLGVNAGVSPATSNFYVRIGLRREFAAVVPKYEDDHTTDKDGKPRQEAASAFVAARMRVISPWKTPLINEILATGDAAVRIAGTKASTSGSGADSTPAFIGGIPNSVEANKHPGTE